MDSNPNVSIYAYNGMKGRLVRALKELERIKGIDRSYTNLAQFIMDHLEKKEDPSVISQPIPEMPPSDETKAHTESLREIFIDNMLDNCKDDDVGFGNRYRDEVYDIAELVKTNSFKTYELIKDIFCFPSEKSLDERYSAIYKEKTSFITDINLVSEIISQYKADHLIEGQIIPVILGVDACSFDRLFSKNKKYAFLFYMQPIDPSFPCVPLHITPHQNGFANEEIISKIKLICDHLEFNGIQVIGISTDGDPNYNDENESTFKIYESMMTLKGFEEAYISYSSHSSRKFFGDLLHILKLARSRILTTLVTVRVDSLEYSFTAADIEPILKLGPALTDISKTGKMRDCYTQQLFTMENLQKLIDAEEYGAALYFMPFCFWASAIFIPNLSRSSRLFLLQTAFETFWSFYTQCIKQKRIAEISTYATVTAIAICFAQKHFMLRCLNSTMAAIYCLRTFPDIGLDRLGTHCLEQYFGNVRTLCHGYDSYENIIKSCVKTLNNMKTYNKYHLKNTTHGRINMAGAKMLEEQNGEMIDLSGIEGLHPQMIAATFFGIVGEKKLDFPEVGGPFGFPPQNDPNEIALSMSLLNGESKLKDYSIEQKLIACQYFDGDDRTGACLDLVNTWSSEIPVTYNNENKSNSGSKIFVRNIAMSTEEMIELQQLSLINGGTVSPNKIPKKRGRPPKKCKFPKNKQTFISTNVQFDPNEINMICENKLKEIQNINFSSENDSTIDQPSEGNMEAESNSESSLTNIDDHKDVDTNENETHQSIQPEIPVAWDIISPCSKRNIEEHLKRSGHNAETASEEPIPLCLNSAPYNFACEWFQAITDFGVKKKAYKFLSLANPTRYDQIIREYVPNPDEQNV